MQHADIKKCVAVCPEDQNFYCDETLTFYDDKIVIRYEKSQCIAMCPTSSEDARFPEYASKQTGDYLCVKECTSSIFVVDSVEYLMYREILFPDIPAVQIVCSSCG